MFANGAKTFENPILVTAVRTDQPRWALRASVVHFVCQNDSISRMAGQNSTVLCNTSSGKHSKVRLEAPYGSTVLSILRGHRTAGAVPFALIAIGFQASKVGVWWINPGVERSIDGQFHFWQWGQ